uniref:Uncharacterized protein n=1 Tax=Trichogramma kaykai TaxID=54128 RepID=A0ABD2X875_9HYME
MRPYFRPYLRLIQVNVFSEGTQSLLKNNQSHFFEINSWRCKNSILYTMKRLGVPIEGRSRMQMNIVATKAENVPFLGPIVDGTLLPVMWVEIGIDELPDSIMKMLYHAYYTVNSIQVIIQCISLSGFILSCIVLYSIRGLNY